MSISPVINSDRRRLFVATVIASGCLVASIAAPVPAIASTVGSNLSSVSAASVSAASVSTAAADTSQLDADFLAALESLPPGEAIDYAIDGSTVHVSNVAGRIHVNAAGDERAVCAVTVASGLVLLGAAGLATLAFATAGAGGAIIAGQVFTTSQIWAAAGLLGAWGALLTWVEGHICK